MSSPNVSSLSTSYNENDHDDTDNTQREEEGNETTDVRNSTSNESLGDATSGNTSSQNINMATLHPLFALNSSSSFASSQKSSSPSSPVVGSPANSKFQQSASIPINSRSTPPPSSLPPQRRTVQIMDEKSSSKSNPFDINNSSKYENFWDSRSSTPSVDMLEPEFMRSLSTTSMSHMPRTFHFDQQQNPEERDRHLPAFVRMSSSISHTSSLSHLPSMLPKPEGAINSAHSEKQQIQQNSKPEISSPTTLGPEGVKLNVPVTFSEQFRKRSVSGANDVMVGAGASKANAAAAVVWPAVVVPESYANKISCEAPADLSANEQLPPALSGKTAEEQDLKDPWCDPERPRKISFADVAAAAVRIRAIPVTSCQRSHFIADVTGIDVYLKKEIENYTGSFKERGVRNALLNLSDAQRRKGVVAASAGNHALGMCHHGKLLGVPVTVVMPTVAPLMKVSNCQALGGNIIINGNDVVEAKKYAMQIARDKGLMYLNGYDHPDVLAGQGSIGIELLTQVPDCDAVIVPVGGGGLICGIATAVKALKPDIKVIGVQSHRACAFTFSMREGYAVSCPVKATLADGLAVSKPGVNSVYSSLGLIDKMILVSEDYIALAILRLLEWEKLVAEGAGAIGLAAVFSGQLDEFKGKKVAIIISGGNIDTTILGRCIERGLAVDGRLCRFAVTVPDRPGSIRDLTQCIASVGVGIKDVVHERAWLKSDIFSVQVTCVVETRNATHAQQLESMLRDKYERVVFPKTWIDVDDTSFGLQLNGTSGTKAIDG